MSKIVKYLPMHAIWVLIIAIAAIAVTYLIIRGRNRHPVSISVSPQSPQPMIIWTQVNGSRKYLALGDWPLVSLSNNQNSVWDNTPTNLLQPQRGGIPLKGWYLSTDLNQSVIIDKDLPRIVPYLGGAPPGKLALQANVGGENYLLIPDVTAKTGFRWEKWSSRYDWFYASL